MSQVTEKFFDELVRCGYKHPLRKVTGSIRFDIEHDQRIDHWFVLITKGDIRVSREKRDADAILCTDEAFFDRMARGEAEPLEAWLRNDVTSEGRFRLIVLLERLFPGPPGARHPRAVACARKEQR
jgi:hypothetical protein